ncbi:hypothetical protein PsorP6_018135 [Peronosclerospora sorghi]|uniref:Uncharacterized protein n=1 Tax=Peronosclerospora sorghi TaxID=230839 RepID=A0ACC0WDM4_9STRA|nr:hypothetical protein PsorP6_018135 [Peronosclerospora sorghi]
MARTRFYLQLTCNLFSKLCRLILYVPPEDCRMLFYRCLAAFGSISFAFYAISQMVLADCSVIVFTSPVFASFSCTWTAPFPFFLRNSIFFSNVTLCREPACYIKKLMFPVFFACATLSFGGLICVVRPGFIFGYDHINAQTDESWIAIQSALLGAIGQAFVFISVRKPQGIYFMVIVHYFMLFSMMGSLGYMMFVQRLEKAGIASVMRYLNVVRVFIWEDLLLGEKINYWSIVGAVIICTCAAVIALQKAHSS